MTCGLISMCRISSVSETISRPPSVSTAVSFSKVYSGKALNVAAAVTTATRTA